MSFLVVFSLRHYTTHRQQTTQGTKESECENNTITFVCFTSISNNPKFHWLNFQIRLPLLTTKNKLLSLSTRKMMESPHSPNKIFFLALMLFPLMTDSGTGTNLFPSSHVNVPLSNELLRENRRYEGRQSKAFLPS